MSETLQALRAQKRATDEALRLVACARKKIKRSMAWLDKGSDVERSQRMQIGLRILALSDKAEAALLSFLEKTGNAWLAEQVASESKRITDEFLTMSPSGLVDLLHPRNERDATYAKKAINFLEELQLYEWTLDQNLRKKVAPSIAATRSQQLRFRQQLEARLVDATAQDMTTKPHAFQWFRAWRINWKVTKGKFGPKVALSVPLMRTKAILTRR